MSLRDDILGAVDRKMASVDVPEWPCGAVLVRTLSAAERQAWKAAADKFKNAAAASVAYVVCDEAGGRIFSDEDIPALAGKAAHVLDRIVGAAFDLLPDHKEAEKNS